MINQEEKNRLEQQFAENFSSDLFTRLVDVYIEEGNFTQARSVCEIGLSYHPNHVEGLFLLAQVFVGENDLEGAEKILQVLLLLDQKYLQAAHLLVTVQERLNRPPHLLRRGWEHLLTLDPDNNQAKVFLKRLGGTVPQPPPPVKPESGPAPPQPTSTGAGSVNPRLATFTLVAVLKDQGLYHQALEVLAVLEEKGSDPDRILTERDTINQLIQAATDN
ncbi:MAG: tetratricopeptide repeat protein [Candidatus Marinimicrobia bacterium]|nr:tetratricopeptide repeat protein [Candidatus Neomarinimicrobiota bacterium]